jgi:hypothetical protein
VTDAVGNERPAVARSPTLWRPTGLPWHEAPAASLWISRHDGRIRALALRPQALPIAIRVGVGARPLISDPFHPRGSALERLPGGALKS